MLHLKNWREVEVGTTFLFRDMAGSNAFNREILQYEYTGYLKKVHNDESRLGIGEWAYGGVEDYLAYMGQYYQKRYLLNQYERKFPVYLVNIYETEYRPGIRQYAKLIYYYWMSPADFAEDAGKIVSLRIESLSIDDYVQRGWIHYELGMPPQSFGPIRRNMH